jgi:hypothetical protein
MPNPMITIVLPTITPSPARSHTAIRWSHACHCSWLETNEMLCLKMFLFCPQWPLREHVSQHFGEASCRVQPYTMEFPGSSPSSRMYGCTTVHHITLPRRTWEHMGCATPPDMQDFVHGSRVYESGTAEHFLRENCSKGGYQDFLEWQEPCRKRSVPLPLEWAVLPTWRHFGDNRMEYEYKYMCVLLRHKCVKETWLFKNETWFHFILTGDEFMCFDEYISGCVNIQIWWILNTWIGRCKGTCANIWFVLNNVMVGWNMVMHKCVCQVLCTIHGNFENDNDELIIWNFTQIEHYFRQTKRAVCLK